MEKTKDAYSEGYNSKPFAVNPYPIGSKSYEDWNIGRYECKMDMSDPEDWEE